MSISVVSGVYFLFLPPLASSDSFLFHMALDDSLLDVQGKENVFCDSWLSLCIVLKDYPETVKFRALPGFFYRCLLSTP